mmetsp:Transcript_20557/g.56748  ORF Transcript_20557/g.56748 Transcript_20557/m.56748 type:complete len:113 (-) Transcript_20557:501-839(-)
MAKATPYVVVLENHAGTGAFKWAAFLNKLLWLLSKAPSLNCPLASSADTRNKSHHEQPKVIHTRVMIPTHTTKILLPSSNTYCCVGNRVMPHGFFFPPSIILCYHSSYGISS